MFYLLVVSQTLFIAEVVSSICNSSHLLRVCEDLSMSQRGRLQSALRFRLIGSQTHRQQLFKWANIHSPVRLQVFVLLVIRPK